MADYPVRTIMTPPLPDEALSLAERLLFDMMFESSPAEDGGRFFFAGTTPTFEGELDSALVASAIAISPPGIARTLLEAVQDRSAPTVPIDIAGDWERLLQDIVRREAALTHIVVVTAFISTTIRADGFGGAATVITAEAIDSLSTFDFVETVLAARLSVKT